MKNLLIVLLFVFLLVIWFNDAIFSNKIFVHGDLFRYFYPQRQFSAESIRGFHCPLWIPHISCGKPFLASLQSAIFYPLSIIYYMIPDFPAAFNWYIIIHFLLAGLFMYFLLRHWRFSVPASLLSGSVFTFGGYLSSVINMNTSLSSAIWTPLVFLFMDKSLNGKGFKFMFLTALLLGFQFLGGEPTLIYCSFWMLLFYVLLKTKVKLKIRILIFGSIFALFFLLFMFQILPFMEFLANSNLASGRSFKAAARWSVTPLELLGFVIPFGWEDLSNHQLWMISFYMGLPVFLFSIILFYLRPGKKAYYFGIVFIISLLMALGKYTAFYSFLYRFLPGLENIRYPVKFISVSAFSLSILSGMGFSALLNENMLHKKQNIIRWILVFNFLLALMLVKPLGNYFYQLFIILTGTVFLIMFWFLGKMSKYYFSFLVIALVLGDLAGRNMGITKTMSKKMFLQIPESVQEIKDSSSLFRIYQTEDVWEINRSVYGPDYGGGICDRKKTFASNTAVPEKISDVMGYDSIEGGEFYSFIMFLRSQPFKNTSKLLNLLNVKYVISTEPINESGFTVIYKDSISYQPILHNGREYRDFYINKNLDYLERAFLADGAVVSEDKSIVLGIMQNENFDPKRVVILEEEPKLVDGGGFVVSGKESCEIISYKPEEVIIETEANKPKWLVLSDTYYPGWKVFVDSRQDKIFKADYFLRAVYLTPGKHKIRFVYNPMSFKIGVLVSSVTLLVSLIIMLKR